MYLLVLVLALSGQPFSLMYCCEEGVREFPTLEACEQHRKTEADRLSPVLDAEVEKYREARLDVSYQFQCLPKADTEFGRGDASGV